jgi:hypothetical protein
MKLQKSQGQSLYEYAILLAIVVAVFTGMQIYLKRGIQGMIKLSTDEFGEQALDKNDEYGDLHPLKGRLLSSDSATVSDATTNKQLLGGGSEKTDVQQTTTRSGSSTYRIGFEPKSLK